MEAGSKDSYKKIDFVLSERGRPKNWLAVDSFFVKLILVTLIICTLCYNITPFNTKLSDMLREKLNETATTTNTNTTSADIGHDKGNLEIPDKKMSKEEEARALRSNDRELRELLGRSDGLKFIKNRPLGDLYDGGFDIPNEGLCPASGEPLKLFIFVESARIHMDRRMAIRQTYGHYALRKDMKVAFIVGRPAEPEGNSTIEEESRLYGDIIAGRFVDSFQNLTLKTTAILEWTTTYCPKVKFILKADDDVFLVVPTIIRVAESHGNRARIAIGYKYVGIPERASWNSHSVPFNVYRPRVWPEFAYGQATYLLSGDIVRDLYEKGLHTAYLNQEDIFYTAFVLQAVKGTKIFLDDLHIAQHWYEEKEEDKCNFEKNISIFAPKIEYLSYLWRRVLDGHQNCKTGDKLSWKS